MDSTKDESGPLINMAAEPGEGRGAPEGECTPLHSSGVCVWSGSQSLCPFCQATVPFWPLRLLLAGTRISDPDSQSPSGRKSK